MNRDHTKLLLIMPPQQGLLNGFACGLISLANYIATRMPEVCTDILDLSGYSFDDAKEKIIASRTDLQDYRLFVGITTTTASYQSALFVARTVKIAAPHAIIVLGGHHASADPETILHYHSGTIDLIIIGEGEKSLCELIRHYPALKAVPGAAFLNDGTFTRTAPPVPLTTDELDSIAISYGDNGLVGTPGKFDHVTYVSARGCPLPCAFCAVGNEQIRTKSVGAVVRDIELLLDMGISRIAIEDNFFAHSPSRTREICEALADLQHRRNSTFAWDCQTRVESLARKETIALMERAGCEAVYIGVESLDPGQLRYLNKAANPTKYLSYLVDRVVPALLETKVDCYLNLQFGLPGETVEHELQTAEVLGSLGELAASRGKVITIFPQLHVVYPGTAHYQQGVSEGRFPADVFESFTEWEAHELPVLNWLGKHFAHGTGGLPEGILKPALLRHAEYDIDSRPVFRILDCLRTIDDLPGIRVFRYGAYIVPRPSFTSADALLC